jgi:hypothetical protein
MTSLTGISQARRSFVAAAMAMSRSVDYPLTYIEIFIEEDGGKSEGSLIPAARVRSKGGNNIEIENFGIYPARLTNIKVGKK